MSDKENENLTEEVKEEVKKEFQLERMILFSDAVFAIVITLMAMEIKLPDARMTQHEFLDALLHLAPVVLAYAVSFMFIGILWYRHLSVFSVLKSYDKGLVIRNLMLLFCVGLFPFGASVISKGKDDNILPMLVYIGIIFMCMCAQYALTHYILIGSKNLRNEDDLTPFLAELRRRKIMMIVFAVIIALILSAKQFMSDEEIKSNMGFLLLLVPVTLRLTRKKKS